MVIYGRIIQALPLQQGVGQTSGKPWKKQEYILETVESYPKKVCFGFFGDKVEQNPLVLGEFYNISFDLNSREFNGRWFTSVDAFKAEKAMAPQAMPTQPATAVPQAAPAAAPQQYAPQPTAPAAAPAAQPLAQPAAAPAPMPPASDDDLPF